MYSKYLAEQHCRIVAYKKGKVIYEPGQHPRYVYFVKSGEVRMFTVSNEGKEFTQGVFKVNQYFGEPALLLQRPYLAYTVALKDTELILADLGQFQKLIGDHKDFSMELIRTLSDRLFYKSMMLEELANEQADHRLRTLINYLGKELQAGELLNVTRQALADRSGLRVETVIRTLKKMAEEGSVKLIRGKIVKTGI
jgi:CRP/FNR family cyclic AMP-dependent transcriptional regulator